MIPLLTESAYRVADARYALVLVSNCYSSLLVITCWGWCIRLYINEGTTSFVRATTVQGVWSTLRSTSKVPAARGEGQGLTTLGYALLDLEHLSHYHWTVIEPSSLAINPCLPCCRPQLQCNDNEIIAYDILFPDDLIGHDTPNDSSQYPYIPIKTVG